MTGRALRRTRAPSPAMRSRDGVALRCARRRGQDRSVQEVTSTTGNGKPGPFAVGCRSSAWLVGRRWRHLGPGRTERVQRRVVPGHAPHSPSCGSLHATVLTAADKRPSLAEKASSTTRPLQCARGYLAVTMPTPEAQPGTDRRLRPSPFAPPPAPGPEGATGPEGAIGGSPHPFIRGSAPVSLRSHPP